MKSIHDPHRNRVFAMRPCLPAIPKTAFPPGLGFLLLLSIVLMPVSTMADLRTAIEAYKRGDHEYALYEFTRLAQRGNPKAQRMLADMYEGGAGVPRDYAEAFKWYLLAAHKGDVLAQFMVAQMYYAGKGGPKDPEAAFKWYRLAAEKGHTYAQYNLGVLYELGNGVSKSPRDAFTWYLKAAQRGVNEAQHKVGYLYSTGEGIGRDPAKAYYWLDRAASGGNRKAAADRDTLAEGMRPDDLSRAKALPEKEGGKPHETGRQP